MNKFRDILQKRYSSWRPASIIGIKLGDCIHFHEAIESLDFSAILGK